MLEPRTRAAETLTEGRGGECERLPGDVEDAGEAQERMDRGGTGIKPVPLPACLAIARLEETLQRLRRLGHDVELHELIPDRPQAFVRDPSGNVLELTRLRSTASRARPTSSPEPIDAD